MQFELKFTHPTHFKLHVFQFNHQTYLNKMLIENGLKTHHKNMTSSHNVLTRYYERLTYKKWFRTLCLQQLSSPYFTINLACHSKVWISTFENLQPSDCFPTSKMSWHSEYVENEDDHLEVSLLCPLEMWVTYHVWSTVWHKCGDIERRSGWKSAAFFQVQP